MQKIKVEIDEIIEKIKAFYTPSEWHFLSLNGVDLGEGVFEVQWIFSKYEALDEVIIFYSEIAYTQEIPSIADLIPSALISQRELVDMFGVKAEGSEKGLYLDEDSMQAPLMGCQI